MGIHETLPLIQASTFYFLADLNSLGWAVSAGITYTPNIFYNGPDTLRVAISDQVT
jgi:hypothetical protein